MSKKARTSEKDRFIQFINRMAREAEKLPTWMREEFEFWDERRRGRPFMQRKKRPNRVA